LYRSSVMTNNKNPLLDLMPIAQSRATGLPLNLIGGNFMAKRKNNYPHYSAVHIWLRSKYGSASKCENELCESRNPKRFEWALKKGCVYENKIENFMQLCPSCHRKYDLTDEARKKMSDSHKGIPVNEKPIIQLDIHGNKIQSFTSLKQASILLKISRTGISNNLSGLSKSAGGFIWKYDLQNDNNKE